MIMTNDKNSLLDGLNIRKTELYVNNKKTTDDYQLNSSIPYFAKMAGC
jgi:hypothetical protein